MARLLLEDRSVFASRWELWAPYVAEFLGTFVVTITFLFNSAQTIDPVWTVTSTGFMLMAMMNATQHVSGGNLNPSVSISLYLSGRYTFRVTSWLCFVQVLGAVTAAVILEVMGIASHVKVGPHHGHGWFDVFVVEVLYSAMLCFVYLNCAASTRNNPVGDPNGFTGLAVGFCLIAGGYATHTISSTVMNSATALGLSIVGVRHHGVGKGLSFLCYDVFGAFLAAGAYRMVRPKEHFSMSGHEEEDDQAVADETDTAPLIAEWIGTFFVIFTQALNRTAARKDPSQEAWSVGAAILCLSCALRDVSGSHFNPAVTLAARASGRSSISNFQCMVYVIMQLIAGLTAISIYEMIGHSVLLTIKLGGDAEGSSFAAYFSECLFTMFLCYSVLATCVVNPIEKPRSKQNNVGGFSYAAAYIVGGFCCTHISGGVLNPAVAVAFSGLSILQQGPGQETCMAYINFELCGALLAALVFYATHARLYSREREPKRLEDASKQESASVPTPVSDV